MRNLKRFFGLWILVVFVMTEVYGNTQMDGWKVTPADSSLQSPMGIKLEALRIKLEEAFILVPKVPIEEQSLYLEKGLPAIFHYGNMISTALVYVRHLTTMEEMFALIPEGPGKERMGHRLAAAYQSTRDGLLLSSAVELDFQINGKLKEDEVLRSTVEKMRQACTDFLSIYEERSDLIKKGEKQRKEQMFRELEDVAKGLKDSQSQKAK